MGLKLKVVIHKDVVHQHIGVKEVGVLALLHVVVEVNLEVGVIYQIMMEELVVLVLTLKPAIHEDVVVVFMKVIVVVGVHVLQDVVLVTILENVVLFQIIMVRIVVAILQVKVVQIIQDVHLNQQLILVQDVVV